MGYLTVVTINNDSVEQVKVDPQEFCNKLYETVISGTSKGVQYINHGDRTRLVKVHPSKHSSDSTVYVHYHGVVYEMSICAKETERLIEQNPEFCRKMVDIMKAHAANLEDLLEQKK